MSAVAETRRITAELADIEPAERGQRIVLDCVDWPAYVQIGEAFRDRAGLRLTYDRGRLEIMTLSFEHERQKHLFGRLIDALSEEINVLIAGCGSTTFSRKDLERGLEPDLCYYHKNWKRVRRLKRIDLTRHPPPDLALEVDVTHSSMNRLGIYAAIKVPEVWRYRDGNLDVYLLSPAGKYQPGLRSPTVPKINIGDFVRFADIGLAEGELKMVQAFRPWVREQMAKA